MGDATSAATFGRCGRRRRASAGRSRRASADGPARCCSRGARCTSTTRLPIRSTTSTRRQQLDGYRTVLGVPLLREGSRSASIIADAPGGRGRSRDKQIELSDLRRPGGDRDRERAAVRRGQTRTRELTEALEQQTATAEVLRVISGSPADLQPVFDTIVESARRLCERRARHLSATTASVFTVAAQRGVPTRSTMPRERTDSAPGATTCRLARSLERRRSCISPTLLDDRRAIEPGDAAGRIGGLSHAASACRCCGRASRSASITSARAERPALHREADRAAADLRRSGGDRDRERAAVRGGQARTRS